ncbi:MAG: hypothetical protein OEL69_09040 [Nitrosopumilus sp.]|nr:hypothetical protein [Nitrosopumilus sp.]
MKKVNQKSLLNWNPILDSAEIPVMLIIATVRIMKLKQAYGFKLRPKWKY